jgi:hypothetical protein
VGSRASLHDVEKRKFLILPGLELRPLRSSSPLAIAIPTALSRFLCNRNSFTFFAESLGIEVTLPPKRRGISAVLQAPHPRR